MHQIIFYLTYLSIPSLVIFIFLIIKNKTRFYLYFFLILNILFIYAKFIEPNIITINTTQIHTGFKANFVVISDLHIGVYKDKNFLKRVVDKINKQKDINGVIIAGDLSYYPKGDLESLFSPLKDIKFPIYAVLGNHDVGFPGDDLTNDFKTVFKDFNISYLENSSIKVGNINIVGLGDNFIFNDDVKIINNFKSNDNLIVIAHNPDTTQKYTNNIPDITISGHTHGGQIRIPFIYKYAIPCKGNFDKGLTKEKNGQLFVSSGLGEVGLPLRFLNPPVIDILKMY